MESRVSNLQVLAVELFSYRIRSWWSLNGSLELTMNLLTIKYYNDWMLDPKVFK